LEPLEVAHKLNRQFSRNPEARQFFTLAYGVLNLDSREFHYINTGHTPILHQRGQESPTMLDGSGSPIGLDPDCQDFVQRSLVLETGDRLLLYTDGLTDALNPDGEIFGAAHLLELLAQLSGQPLDVTNRSI